MIRTSDGDKNTTFAFNTQGRDYLSLLFFFILSLTPTYQVKAWRTLSCSLRVIRVAFLQFIQAVLESKYIRSLLLMSLLSDKLIPVLGALTNLEYFAKHDQCIKGISHYLYFHLSFLFLTFHRKVRLWLLLICHEFTPFCYIFNLLT